MATRKQLLDQNDNEILPITDTESVRNPQNIGGTLEGRLATVENMANTAIHPLPVGEYTENNFASFDSNGGIKDSGCNEGTFIKGVKKGTETLTPENGVVTIPSDIESAHATSVSSNQSATATIDSNHVLQLEIPRGADAVNPFKGYFDSLSDLQNKYHTGETGDFANVYDSTADKTYRYVWDASLSTPAWTQALDSSSQPIEVTPSTATFATGEELINVGIVKDESSETSDGVWGSSLSKDLHDTILGEIIKLSPTNSESKVMLKKDGTTVAGAYNVLRVYGFTVTGGRKYRIKGRVGATSGTCLYVFYNSLGNVINFGYESTGTPTPYDVEVYSPSNATTIKVNGNVSPTSPFEPSVYYKTDDVCLQKEVDSINVIMPKDYEYGVKIGSDGTTSTALTKGSVVNSYDVEPNMQYVVCGASPSKSSGNLAIAFFNSSNVFLGGCISGEDSNTVFKDYIAMTPPNASVMKVYGRYNADVLVRPLITNAEDSFRNAATCCPQITQNPLPRKNITEPLKILLFGSSWHLNVWYYLNKIIASAGIDAEIHGYYIGHSMFDEWVQLYNNDLTPFNGDEETRQATRCVSTNGSDWSIKTYRTNYTKQQYRDDFYNDITSGDWTIIGFQQGARQAPYWQYWNNYSDIVSVIKRNCSFDTQIAFTATWTPAVSSSDMAPDPNTVAGQQNWQIKNNNNTKRFILQTGINKVAPCGSLMWAMRRSQTLNLSGDLASDGLHPDNGLPMYALAALWYDTYVAPIYGISISNVNWLPDTSTQKAPFTNYYQTINLTQRSEIVNLIHLAQSDRFGFRS